MIRLVRILSEIKNVSILNVNDEFVGDMVLKKYLSAYEKVVGGNAADYDKFFKISDIIEKYHLSITPFGEVKNLDKLDQNQLISLYKELNQSSTKVSEIKSMSNQSITPEMVFKLMREKWKNPDTLVDTVDLREEFGYFKWSVNAEYTGENTTLAFLRHLQSINKLQEFYSRLNNINEIKAITSITPEIVFNLFNQGNFNDEKIWNLIIKYNYKTFDEKDIENKDNILRLNKHIFLRFFEHLQKEGKLKEFFIEMKKCLLT